MGSASTKFRKHLQGGDEVQALQLYRTNAELRKALDPNCSYGDSHNHETPLHLVSRHGMQMLLGIFLFSKAGNPNKSNARKETSLHCLCQQDSNWQSVHSNRRRAECLNYLLKWRGPRLAEGSLEKIDLAAQDEKLNTALHYAAASGLAQCVETLIQQGAPLFVENEDNLTPCDTAERNGHNDIALFLESKMVFSNDEEPVDEEDNISMPPMEEYSGLRPQDLQEAKDMLLVETADMLSVPLFTAEALLRNHEWSRETLLESWMTDPVACCEKCGVTPPASLFSDKPQVQENLASPLPSPLHSTPMSLDADCDICANTFLIADEPVHIACSHKFCKECWERYLNVKIQEGDAHHITCPAYDCTMLVPVEVIEGIVSRDMARRYLQFDIKAFVDSNPDMKWCPFPGCGRAVKLPELGMDGGGGGGGGHASRASGGGGHRARIPSDTSRGVDCGGGHYFCWECLEESHEPCSCSNWHNWFEKIADVKPETCKLYDTEQETELAANCLWLVTNSKPCPNCKSPIQKNEGCNHMKCSKCKYDFCWVCLEQWKRHNSSTGGYFMCNRYEVVKKVEEQNAQVMTEAESKNKNMQELNRFVHYYTRFKNHENSFKLEEPLLKTAKDKMMKLAEAVTDSATAQTETKFVEDAVQQLLKARRVLKCSYVYGYYLDGPGYKKIVFEFMQTELEECTEILSQMVNRLYLRTPRRKIIDQAHVVQRKRQEFIMAISKGLVPAETPPSVRKKRKKKKKAENEEVDEDLHRAIVESIKEVDPSNPWIKDASGKHTNVVALLDWPSEDSDDSDAETEKKKASMGKCQREDCPKLRAKNPRTQEAHDYCSQWCMLADRDLKGEDDRQEGVSDVVLDEHMELLRALEMSRLQYLQESGLLHVPDSQQSAASTRSTQTRRHKHRPRSNSAGQDVKSRPAVSSMEDFDLELQRFQELSGGYPKQHSDSKASGHQQHSTRNKPANSSRFDENKSTIVTRVPNKSVEDLYCLDPSVKQRPGQQQPLGSPIYGSASSPGPSSSPSTTPFSSFSSMSTTADRKPYHSSLTSPPPPPDLLSFTFNEDKDNNKERNKDTLATVYCSAKHEKKIIGQSNDDNDGSSGGGSNMGLYGTMFGAIKDLSVSNIHSNESDKTKDFTNKDLASIFASLNFQKEEEHEGEEELDDEIFFPPSTSTLSSSKRQNDLSSKGCTSNSGGFKIKPAAGGDVYSNMSGKGVSCKSSSVTTTPKSMTDKGKGRVGDGRRRVKGESSRNTAMPQAVELYADPYRHRSGSSSSSSRQQKSSPSALYLAAAQYSGIEDDDDDDIEDVEVMKENNNGGGVEAIRLGVVEEGAGDAGKVSLLKMAENLVQMTADVHLRMKEVEKGIRDLDSRSKLESLKRGEGIGCYSGNKTNNNSSTSMVQSVEIVDDIRSDDLSCDDNDNDDNDNDKQPSWLVRSAGDGGDPGSGVGDVCSTSTKRSTTTTNAESLSVCSDVDDADTDQWYDVLEITPVVENYNTCSSSSSSAVAAQSHSNLQPSAFNLKGDDDKITVLSSSLQASKNNNNNDNENENTTDYIDIDDDEQRLSDDAVVSSSVSSCRRLEMPYKYNTAAKNNDLKRDDYDSCFEAAAGIENGDLSITSGNITTAAYSKKSHGGVLNLKLSGNSGEELKERQQQQQQKDSNSSFKASTSHNENSDTTNNTTTTTNNTFPLFQSLLRKSPVLSDNFLPSCGDDKDFSNSTREKNVEDLSLGYGYDQDDGKNKNFSKSVLSRRSEATATTGDIGVRGLGHKKEDREREKTQASGVAVAAAGGGGREDDGNSKSRGKEKGGSKKGRSSRSKKSVKEELEEYLDSVYV